MDFDHDSTALAPIALMRRGRYADAGVPALTIAFWGGSLPSDRASQRGVIGKCGFNGRGPGSVRGVDV